jgi:hypothetical protein
VIPAGGGDVGVASQLHDPDGEVPQRCHDLGAVASADLGGVFAVGGVTDVVEDFDVPVAAYPPGELGRGGLGDGQASDGVDGNGAPLAGAQGPDTAGEAQRLGGVGEGEPGGDGGGLEGTVLLAAVAPAVLAGAGCDVPPGQILELGIQAGLVLFTTRM